MEFIDRVLKCIDCGAEFVFTAGEQLFFHDKQFMNDPKRCKQCKAKRASGGLKGAAGNPHHLFGVRQATTVPFKPTQGRPVLCRSCFQKLQVQARRPELSSAELSSRSPLNPEGNPAGATSVASCAQWRWLWNSV